MSIAAIPEHMAVLPDTPYAMWVRDELREFLHLPHDHTRVEIVGGEIVVSPGARAGHEAIAKGVERAFWRAELTDPEFPWATSNIDLNLVGIEEGYVPDLMVLREDVIRAIRAGDDRYALPDHLEMVLEVTSKSNAGNDREPTIRRPATKWTGYARAEIPYYLLVDRDPKARLITLFSVPDQGARAYLHRDTWKFGEMITLEHFGVEIDTTGWEPWKG